MKKPVDPDDTYVIREMFACGEGHFMCPGFTHWESGEACPWRHSDDATNEDVHLYYRNIMVPTSHVDKLFNTPENAGKWGHLPVASK